MVSKLLFVIRSSPMDRQIVCFSIPTFQIALAQRADSSLQRRPVAVAISSDPRSVITETSREAREDGVVANMPVSQARRLCPSLHLLAHDPAQLRQANRALVNVASRYTPAWESVQPGHLYFDLTGTTRLFGLACDTAMRVEQEIAQHNNLRGVAGIGNSKLVSHIASTLVEPPQLCDVRPGSEETFLAPLSVDTLPLWATSRKMLLMLLDDLNLRTLGEIAQTKLADLALVFGRHANLLHSWARGVDPSRVLPPAKQPCTEATLNLGAGELDINRLHGLLYGLLERICCYLRAQERQCHHLTMRLQYCDDVEIERVHPVSPGTSWEVDLEPHASQLLARCFRRRVRVRALTLRAGQSSPSAEQLTLFAHNAESTLSSLTRPYCLSRALDQIRTRYGRRAIWWGKTHAAVCSSARPF